MRQIKNLVFEGGGILGIAYLGVLEYLSKTGIMKDVLRVGGTSVGAITACILSFNLPFLAVKNIVDSLDYKKIPSKTAIDNLDIIPEEIKEILNELFGDMNCIYRLLHHYGWFSTEYFYSWIKEVIAEQFDITKKRPPYTFSDFKDSSLHKGNRPFLDLYVVGTNLSMKSSKVYSYETTPMTEVAKAVQVSMSIPLLFEAVEEEIKEVSGSVMTNVLCDGGAMNNYPLGLFDSPKFNPALLYGVNMETLGVRFLSRLKYDNISNLLEYIESLLHLSSYIQQEIYENNPLNKVRSIEIDTYDVNPIDFDITSEDSKYKSLYNQGYIATKNYFSKDFLYS